MSETDELILISIIMVLPICISILIDIIRVTINRRNDPEGAAYADDLLRYL